MSVSVYLLVGCSMYKHCSYWTKKVRIWEGALGGALISSRSSAQARILAFFMVSLCFSVWCVSLKHSFAVPLYSSLLQNAVILTRHDLFDLTLTPRLCPAHCHVISRDPSLGLVYSAHWFCLKMKQLGHLFFYSSKFQSSDLDCMSARTISQPIFCL